MYCVDVFVVEHNGSPVMNSPKKPKSYISNTSRVSKIITSYSLFTITDKDDSVDEEEMMLITISTLKQENRTRKRLSTM